MYQYIRIQYRFFVEEQTFDGYQEIETGIVIRNTDLDGNTVDLGQYGSCDSWVVDAEPPTPAWAV